MTIAVGDTLPDGEFLQMTDEGPQPVALAPLVKGRKVVIFGLPGAYTGTCSTAHVPSFMRNMDALKAKGVDDVICVSVNDPFVMFAWGKNTGATAAGIHMLADPESKFVEALGMRFDAPPAGLIGRSKRFALMAEDGVVKHMGEESNPGACDISSGDALVEAI